MKELKYFKKIKRVETLYKHLEELKNQIGRFEHLNRIYKGLYNEVLQITYNKYNELEDLIIQREREEREEN